MEQKYNQLCPGLLNLSHSYSKEGSGKERERVHIMISTFLRWFSYVLGQIQELHVCMEKDKLIHQTIILSSTAPTAPISLQYSAKHKTKFIQKTYKEQYIYIFRDLGKMKRIFLHSVCVKNEIFMAFQSGYFIFLIYLFIVKCFND